MADVETETQESRAGTQDPWSRLSEQITEYQKVIQLEEAGKLAEGERGPSDLLPGIDASFWRLMTDSVSGLVSEPMPENLTWNDRLAFALNYGLLLDNPDFAWAVQKAQAFMPLPPENLPYSCVYVTQALNIAYRGILKVDSIKKLNEDLERIKKAMDDAPEERAEAIRQRDHAVSEHIKAAPDVEKLKTIFASIDKDLEMMKMMEKKNREGGFSGKEERQRYISLTQSFEQRTQQVDHIFERHPGSGDEIKRCHQAADESLTNLIQLRDDKRQKEKDIEREKSAVHNISLIDVKAGIEEEVGKLKGNGRLTSKLGKSAQFSMPLQERDLVTPDKACEALAKIEEMDPNLFNNRGAKRKGIPALFIVPGVGEGIYDWEGHRLLIPVMYTRTVLASVASAVVLYKVDVDQSYNDRELILSYKNDIKEHKKIRSMIKLRQQLIKDYLLWVVKEAAGFPLMEKQNREWFEYRVGPNKYEPKFPKDMRNLTLKQQREGLEAELKKETTPTVLWRQALFHYLMDGENQDALAKEVYPRLEEALKQAPNDLDIIYSTGAIYRKVKNKRCIELFVDYTKKAPQSWWSKKALELVTTFK